MSELQITGWAEEALGREEGLRRPLGWDTAGSLRAGWARAPQGNVPGHLTTGPPEVREGPIYLGGPGNAPREGGLVQSHLMDGLPLPLSPCTRAYAAPLPPEGEARANRPDATFLTHPPNPAPASGGDPDAYLWRLAGRGALWAWGSPGLRAPAPPV